jgi:hypothetical protein
MLSWLGGCATQSADNLGTDTHNAGGQDSHRDLHTAFVIALSKDWAGSCDIDKTAAYYRQHPSAFRMIDLNCDGVEEAICLGDYVIYPGEGKVFIRGYTGNGPILIMHRSNGSWEMIADVSGLDYEIMQVSINGWPVLAQVGRLGIDAYPTTVHVYDDGRYKPVVTFTRDGEELRQPVK